MSEVIPLWSIQHAAAWEKAKSRGSLKADGRRIWPEHRPAYKWMAEQMRDRLPGYDAPYPIWAWTERPDLRRRIYLPPGTPGVRLGFTACADEILISDFSAWHSVLNSTFCSLTEAEDDLLRATQRRQAYPSSRRGAAASQGVKLAAYFRYRPAAATSRLVRRGAIPAGNFGQHQRGQRHGRRILHCQIDILW
jgi:hypothetical protein